MIIMSAIGGMNVTETVEGLERYPVNIRYPRDYRDDLESLKRVLVPEALSIAWNNASTGPSPVLEATSSLPSLVILTVAVGIIWLPV